MSDMKCSHCEIQICGQCRMIKQPQHKCKQEDILSSQMIENDSKLCPKCHAFVFKLSGCNDMFCTNCLTSFNWVTLHINQGFIPHNPHLAELRSRLSIPENQNIGCIDLFDESKLQKVLYGYAEKSDSKINQMLQILYHIVRELDMIIRDYNENRGTDYSFHFKVAKEYLSRSISKEIRKNKLWCNKVENDYHDELSLIRRAWTDSVIAIINNFIAQKRKKHVDLLTLFRKQISEISKFTRIALVELAINDNKMVAPIYPGDDVRMISIRYDRLLKYVLDDYFITNQPRKVSEEQRLLR
jgi:hypothetical protein